MSWNIESFEAFEVSWIAQLMKGRIIIVILLTVTVDRFWRNLSRDSLSKKTAKAVTQQQRAPTASQFDVHWPLFILHVGPAQAGATSIQQFAAKCPDLLKQNGVHYLGGNNDAIDGVISACHRTSAQDKDENKCKHAWDEFGTLLENHRELNHTVFLSQESFSDFPNEELEETHLYDFLLPQLEKWRVQVVFTYRRRYEILWSLYHQLFDPRQPSQQTWPAKGKAAVPSFPEFVEQQEKQETFKHPEAIVSRLRHHFGNQSVAVLNYHGGDLLQRFFCGYMPQARIVCRFLLDVNLTTQESNPSKSTSRSLWHDMIAVEAYRRGLLFGKRFSRKDIADSIEKHSAVVKKADLKEYPVVRLSANQTEALLLHSHAVEKTLVPDFYSKDDLDVGFQQFLDEGRLVSVDANAVLRDPQWKNFFSTLVYPNPQITWLMSFPNSGTSYTMTMVSGSSNRAFATNSCDEVTPPGEECLSIYPERPEGPFWVGNRSQDIEPRRPLPDKYVITKTHCGFRCLACGPDRYVGTPAPFLKQCASGHARVPRSEASHGLRRIDVDYPPERVAKAIHLIRNPFHNIISRYHMERRNRDKRNETEWLERHGNDAAGFQAFCRDLDGDYKDQDEEFFGKDKIPKAPCHGEFYKWTQWHNFVHEGLELIGSQDEVPVLTLYYEDYAKKLNATVASILGFLELELQGEIREFSPRSDYDVYFTKEQERDVQDLIKSVASEKTWTQVKHYFE